MSRDLLSYCITDRASFKVVARAMMKRDGKWPSKIVVSRDVYRHMYNERVEGVPNFTGLVIRWGNVEVRCSAEGDIEK